MPFEFATAARIVFGPGVVQQLPKLVLEQGARALLVTGRSSERAKPILDLLLNGGVQVTTFSVPGEPTTDDVRSGARLAKDEHCQSVIGFGGGSPIDAAKAIAILATNSGEPLDYLEVVGKGLPFEHGPLPFLAVPTTAGTGAEVTRNAVLGSRAHGLKASLRNASMLAKVALIDPELTVHLPPEITAYTGLDALTQLIEPFVSSRANPMVDILCLRGLELVRDALLRAYQDGSDLTARESMAFASLLGGLALANAGLGVVHGFAAPLGGMLKAPHGALCAAVLPYGIAANVQALRKRFPDGNVLQKYEQIAKLLTGNADAQPEDLTSWVSALVSKLSGRSLGSLGLSSEQIPSLVAKAEAASSMKANPLPLTREELTEVAEWAL